MVETVRGLVRPVVTFWFAIWIVIFYAYQTWFTRTVDVTFAALVAGVIGWWFYDRGKRRTVTQTPSAPTPV